MKIIYVYKKDPYAAIMAACAHLKLNVDHKPKLVNNKFKKEGYFFYLGIDEELNEVYLLYSRKNGYILNNLLIGFGHIYGEKVMIINTENN